MATRLKRNKNFLRKLKCCNADEKRELIRNCSDSEMKTICDGCYSILFKHVPVTAREFKELEKRKDIVRVLGEKGVSLQNKKKLLAQQTGGFLTALIAPVLSFLASTLLPAIAK